MKNREALVVAVVVTLILAGVYNYFITPGIYSTRTQDSYQSGGYGGMGPGMMGGYQQVPDSSQFSSTGEMIYYTGYNQDGQRVRPSGGPNWLYMRGGSCVDCHGASGTGGEYIMGCFSNTTAHDIRYSTLTEEHEDHEAFTEEDIKKAITRGIEPDGERLDQCMPRWQMSKKDLEALVEYLKTLE